MNILDKRFKYVPAAKTDIRKTIARERARLKAEAERKAAHRDYVVAQIKTAAGR